MLPMRRLVSIFLRSEGLCTCQALTVRRALLLSATPVRLAPQINAVLHQVRRVSTEAKTATAGRELRDENVARTASGEDSVMITDAKGATVDVTPLASFDNLKDSPSWLQDGLGRLRYPSTTVIQSYTIPILDDGHDLIGLAPTGSGKTVAFAVPALKRLQQNDDGSPSVLVLAPTRELVQQTSRVFESLSCGQVRVAEAYGGASREVQARRLHKGCDVLVACPGRLKDFLDNGDVSIRKVSFLVFDEADRLLDMGFQIQLDEIVDYLDRSGRVQTMMWSATWPKEVQELARNYLSPDRLIVRAGTAGTGRQVNEHIKQNVLFAETLEDRIEELAKLIESGKIDENTAKLIIFVERQIDTESTARALSRRLGIDSRYVGVIHGGLTQRQRDMVMSRFKSSRIRLLVATDVASRGLDIPDVTCVVNFQAPKNIDSYCHRIGRTGRAGRSGEAYTFVGRADGAIAADLIDYLQRCSMAVPPQLTQQAHNHRSETAARRGSNRRWDSRGGRDSYRRERRFPSRQSSGDTRRTSYSSPLPSEAGW